MIRTVQHDRCRRCGRFEPAHMHRTRNKDHITDKLMCLGCGAKWKNHHKETTP